MNETSWPYGHSTLIVIFLLATILTIVSSLSYLYGKRIKSFETGNFIDIIPSSLLALFGLILGFTFSIVIGRFEEKRLLAIQEGNAISTAYLRSNLMPAVKGQANKEAFKEYVDLRIKFYLTPSRSKELEKISNDTNLVQDKIWNYLKEVSKTERGALESSYVQSLNEMFDIRTHRDFALDKLIPIHVYLLLLFICLVSLSALSLDRGANHQSTHIRPAMMIIVFSMLLAFLFDMDHPRTGYIQIGQDAIFKVQKMIK